MESIAAFACGGLFAAGLSISGMIDPQKVLGFLDLGGQWDPSLGFVMAGAIAVALPVFQYVARNNVLTLNNKAVKLPENQTIDRTLIVGAALFGIGWGLIGMCPGPAIALAATGTSKSLTFIGAMLFGVVLQGAVSRRQSS